MRAPSNSRKISCGIVASFKDTNFICRRASSPPRRIASATSVALPRPKPTRPFFVANDHERAELEATTTLDNLGGTVDEHNLLDEFFALLIRQNSFRTDSEPNWPPTPTAPRRQTATAAHRDHR
jgi:hypothetical protein